MPMSIVIDCRMLDASGVGVYLRGCLTWFLKSKGKSLSTGFGEGPEDNFMLLGNKTQLQSFASRANVKIIDCNVKPFSLRELFFFPLEKTRQINKANIYYSPFFNIPKGIKIPVCTTIHDIIFPDMPELSSKAGLAIRMWFFRRAYKKSQKIFTVSEFSKSRIEYHLGTEKQVIVTHSAIQPMFLEYRTDSRIPQKRETIVFIGNIKKHKGLDCLLDAFHLAKNEGLPHKLVIIGSKNNFRTSNNTLMQKTKMAGDAISFTGCISDEALLEHLSTAALLVQPSLYEGFCLPPLEAMVLGTPALISDIPVLKEIYADFPVIFFRAGDFVDLKEKIIELLSSKKYSSHVLPDELLQKYTFEKTVQKIMYGLTH